MESIRIRGARTHNLKNLNLDLPRHRLIVITGLSGSGKSSLAFDTLYAEGQRRYVESLSAYARQFLQLMDKPDVDLIEGLSPAISIEQKATSHNPRSTVGTVTEIHDYLRLLYARVGDPYCPDHPEQKLAAMTISQMVDATLAFPEETKLMILAPAVVNRKGEQIELFVELRAKGFVRVRVDGKVYEIDAVPKLAKSTKHTIEVVVDRLKVKADMKQRLAESYETALRHGDGRAIAVEMDKENEGAKEHLFSAKFACPICNYSLAELEPRLFSFNSPLGACPRCDGLGSISFFDPKRVVAFPQLSLASGAIKGWDRRNQFYFQMLQGLAKHVGFDVDRPFAKLPERVQNIILYGSGDEKIPFTYLSERGKPMTREHAFEGIVPNLERRYRETDSVMVREELAKYLNSKPCPECGGTRLKREARHVKVGEGGDARAIFEVSAWPLKTTSEFFGRLHARRPEGGDRRPDRQGDRVAARVPEQRGPRLPGARPLGRNAVRRRVAAHPPRLADRLGPDRRDVRAGRAVDRPAPARQRSAARNAEAPARPRQQRHRRRARPGRDPGRRSRGRHGAGRGRARRTGRCAGHARRHPPRAAFADRPVPGGTAADPDSGEAASRRCGEAARRSRGATGNNLKNVMASAAGGPVRLRDRRVGLGQVDADQRHALSRGRAASCTTAPKSRRPTPKSRASSISTR